MVQWTDFERTTIQDIFSKIDYESVGHQALTRCLVVYPWTQRYFSKFGNLYNAAAILGNPKVAAHGLTVMRGLEKAVKNMDNIKSTYADLSVLHSEQLHVDPQNFRLLADCITIVVASVLGANFTAEVQAALQKFLAVIVSALGKQYY
ncbi:hemoglobin subunit beta [Ictalurus punctatus]|uniref:Hemoglobin subunit beta n=1 Tax=Ictalurus punctatus TaxID=7998 RepID=A0A9F7R1D0_ICTPU|nr:hemoglobin subunit beta-like [Ictalurus punctatus]XP_053531285.1 hemoglobin subunit beta-like [Ictalurus punctatus]XP_053531286.1 hemoglobin subunit beta-like [Ictalurus punctatus]XP_053531442.1 hemoglobin subunit beta [Ictalurus punctatus]